MLPILFVLIAAFALLSPGKESCYEEIEGPWGPLDGVYSVGQKAELIVDFLD
jgi:homoserine O-acetyltransferase